LFARTHTPHHVYIYIYKKKYVGGRRKERKKLIKIYPVFDLNSNSPPHVLFTGKRRQRLRRQPTTNTHNTYIYFTAGIIFVISACRVHACCIRSRRSCHTRTRPNRGYIFFFSGDKTNRRESHNGFVWNSKLSGLSKLSNYTLTTFGRDHKIVNKCVTFESRLIRKRSLEFGLFSRLKYQPAQIFIFHVAFLFFFNKFSRISNNYCEINSE